LRNDVPYFNPCGVDGLISKKRPGTMVIINDQKAPELVRLIDRPQQAQRSFCSANAFHGYIYETVVGFSNTKEKILERLDQPILEVIDDPKKTQQTTAIGTLF